MASDDDRPDDQRPDDQNGEDETRELSTEAPDTRPMFEAAIREMAFTRERLTEAFGQLTAAFGQLAERFERFERETGERFERFEREISARVTGVEKEIRKLAYKIDGLALDYQNLRADLRDLDARLIPGDRRPS